MAASANQEGRLIWIDLEMTGLDTDRDSIIEIATIVTDSQLNILAEGPELAIRAFAVDAWKRWTSGTATSTASPVSGDACWRRASAWPMPKRARWRSCPNGSPPNSSPMCGNSICQDRRFLHRLMPKLEQHFHYRNLDVSTLKELARRWAPQVLAGMRKEAAHTALSDVRDSIAELRHYRRHMAALASD